MDYYSTPFEPAFVMDVSNNIYIGDYERKFIKYTLADICDNCQFASSQFGKIDEITIKFDNKFYDPFILPTLGSAEPVVYLVNDNFINALDGKLITDVITAFSKSNLFWMFKHHIVSHLTNIIMVKKSDRVEESNRILSAKLDLILNGGQTK